MKCTSKSLVLGALCMGLVAWRAGGGDIIKAREIAIVDEDGNTRIHMSALRGMGPNIAFIGEDKQPRFVISVDGGSPLLSFRDNLGKTKLSISVSENEPMINLYGPNEKHQVTILVNDQKSTITIEEDGKTVWTAKD